MEDKVTWLDSLETACRQGGIHGSEFGPALYRVTDGDAKKLVDKYSKHWQTWHELEGFWKARFRAETSCHATFTRLLDCKQGESSISEHNKKFTDIAFVAKVLYSASEFDMLLPLYLDSLNDDLKPKYHTYNFLSLNHAMSKIQEDLGGHSNQTDS